VSGRGAGGRVERLPAPPSPPHLTTSAPRRTSFRSLHAALAAARDGDTVLLLPGTHNGLGRSARVTRRVRLSAHPRAVLDFRGNAPALRLERACAVDGVRVDATGFREGVRVDGGSSLAVHISGCRVSASADDALFVCGGAAASVRGCELKGGRHGVHVVGRARATLAACSLTGEAGAGAAAVQHTTLRLADCEIAGCGEEGVRAAGAARARLDRTDVARCGGPAVDASGASAVTLGPGTTLAGCAGGVWAWDAATAALAAGVSVAADSTYALLTHDDARMTMAAGAAVEGGVRGEAASAAVASPGVAHRVPAHHVGPPAEAGPFEWAPDPLAVD